MNKVKLVHFESIPLPINLNGISVNFSVNFCTFFKIISNGNGGCIYYAPDSGHLELSNIFASKFTASNDGQFIYTLESQSSSSVTMKKSEFNNNDFTSGTTDTHAFYFHIIPFIEHVNMSKITSINEPGFSLMSAFPNGYIKYALLNELKATQYVIILYHKTQIQSSYLSVINCSEAVTDGMIRARIETIISNSNFIGNKGLLFNNMNGLITIKDSYIDHDFVVTKNSVNLYTTDSPVNIVILAPEHVVDSGYCKDKSLDLLVVMLFFQVINYYDDYFRFFPFCKKG